MENWGIGLSKSIRCSDLFPGCSFLSRGDSDDEVLSIALHHAQLQHGLGELDSDLLAKFSAAIRATGKQDRY